MAIPPSPESGRGPCVYGWLNERLGLTTIYNSTLARMVPKTDWFYTLGSAAMILALLQGVTGMLLTIYYVPTPDHAYDSIRYIMNDVMFGWLIRGMHHWGATLLVIVVFLHMLKSYFAGAYKYPRDHLAHRRRPAAGRAGDGLQRVSVAVEPEGVLGHLGRHGHRWRGPGDRPPPGAHPARRPGDRRRDAGGFYGLHIWWIPIIVLGTIGVHLYLVIRIGITSPPERDE